MQIASNPFETLHIDAEENLGNFVREPILGGVWFHTRPLPWYSRYVGPASVPVLGLVCFTAICDWLVPKQHNQDETKLGYSGRIYCVRTQANLYFIASRDNAQLVRVLRRYPTSSLTSCHREHSKSTSVKFEFRTDGCFTLHFNGSNDETAMLTELSNLANA